MLLRLVNPDADASKKISRIHYASSTDGVRFEVGREVIAPASSADPDGAGCEEPTIAFDGDSYGVFCSGCNAGRAWSSMLAAKGNGLDALRKAGNVLVPDDRHAKSRKPLSWQRRAATDPGTYA